MPHEWNDECQRPACRHAYGLHARIGDWCSRCGAECRFLPATQAPTPMFDFNLASKPRLRGGLVRWSFLCGCKAQWSPQLERLEKPHFCQQDSCPSSAYAKEVYDEYLTEQRALAESEIIRLPEKLVTKPGTTVGVLGMLAGLIKRGG